MYLPFSARVATSDSMTGTPTLRTAFRPKRTSLPTAVKSTTDSLTSGERIRMPICRHSAR